MRIQWTFTRSKRRNAGAMWLHDDVAARVQALIEDAPDDRRLLRDEMTGKDYTEDLFIRRWVAVREAAIQADKFGLLRGLGNLQFRDMRRTFGVLSRAGGSTKDDTGDVLGNSAAVNPQLAEVYMPSQLDTASRAVDAIKRPRAPAARKRVWHPISRATWPVSARAARAGGSSASRPGRWSRRHWGGNGSRLKAKESQYDGNHLRPARVG